MAKMKLKSNRHPKGMKGHARKVRQDHVIPSGEDSAMASAKVPGFPLSILHNVNSLAGGATLFNHLARQENTKHGFPADKFVKALVNERDKVKRKVDDAQREIDFLSDGDVKREQAEQFTLHDRLHRETYDAPRFLTACSRKFGLGDIRMDKKLVTAIESKLRELRVKLRTARRFSIDDDTVQQVVRKAHTTPKNVCAYLDLAALPFETMWLEYSNTARVREEHKHDNEDPYQDPEDVPARYGVLMERRTLKEGNKAIEFTTFIERGDGLPMPSLVTYTIAQNPAQPTEVYMVPRHGSTWTSNPRDFGFRMLPWGFYKWDENSNVTADNTDPDLLYLMERSVPDIERFVTGPLMAITEKRNGNLDRAGELWGDSHLQAATDLRFFVTLLAMINIVPTKKVYAQAVQPHYNYKGKQIPYLDHQIVSIEIGKQKIIKVVDHAFRQAMKEAIRKRAHEVRGHYRVLHKGTEKEKRTWVKEHQRGDASLGFVRQTWNINSGEKHA